MNNNYKVGDRVVCLDDRDSTNLEAGFEYDVVAVNDYGNILVSGGFAPLPHFYKPSRFDVIASGQETKKVETNRFDHTKQYKTKEGYEFNFIGFSQCEDYPVVGEYFDGVWMNESWTIDGKQSVGQVSYLDLVEAADKIELSIGGVSIVVYNDRSILIGDECGIATSPATDDEIDSLIAALQAYRS